MVVRDQGEVTVGSVRVEGGITTHPEEVVERVAPGECLEQHFLVIPKKRDQMTVALESHEPLNDAPAVWPPVDVVAQGDDAVLGAGSDRFEQGVERRRTAVDVTDGDGARVHGLDGILTGSRMPP